MPYRPIEAYGVIGDMHSAALVSDDGSIDWCCLPHFNSPSVFASILDDKKGGSFQIEACGESRRRQMYMPDTNVLLTRFLSARGAAEIIDFMPIRKPHGAEETSAHQIVRIVHSIRGDTKFTLRCEPAYDFARSEHRVELTRRGAVFETSGPNFALVSPVPLQRDDKAVTADFTLQAGESRMFIFRCCPDHDDHGLLEVPFDGEAELEHTIAYWRRWLSQSRYEGRWRSMVERSALALKLLSFQPSGAIVAAPTTSLPGEIGGARNFDYRYTWVRDAAFTVYAFLRLGFVEEAGRFVHWLQDRVTEHDGEQPLQVLYGINGERDIAKVELDHLDGYRGSRPVRLGNNAAGQKQLDIYGAAIDSIYLYDKHAAGLPWEVWQNLRFLLDWVADNWNTKDDGIWEVRGGQRHFVYSKVQCWVALDRGLRMARKKGLPLDSERLKKEHDKIYDQVMAEGWNEKRGSFVQHYGSDALDASNLLMPLLKFITANDPRMLQTIERTREDLVEDSLVYRYKIGEAAPDGLPGEEGSFSVCTFWLVEALTRAGQVDEARFIFEKMTAYANPLGLFAEEIGKRGEALGNFPQAYTHLGLISSAFALDKALREQT